MRVESVYERPWSSYVSISYAVDKLLKSKNAPIVFNPNSCQSRAGKARAPSGMSGPCWVSLRAAVW